MKDTWNKALEGKQWHLLKWIIINGGVSPTFRICGVPLVHSSSWEGTIGKTIWHKLPVDCHRSLAILLTSNNGDLPYEWLKEAREAIRECWLAAVRDFRGAVQTRQESRPIAEWWRMRLGASCAAILTCWAMTSMPSCRPMPTSSSWFYGQFSNPFKG